MRLLLIAWILAAAPAVRAAKLIVEDREKLGFGFEMLGLAEPVNVSFESLGHFSYLYYKGQRLARSSKASVSPSGKFAIYQDGPSGNLILFGRADGKRTELTQKFVASAESFEWQEKSGKITVRWYSDKARRAPKPPMTFQLR